MFNINERENCKPSFKEGGSITLISHTVFECLYHHYTQLREL